MSERPSPDLKIEYRNTCRILKRIKKKVNSNSQTYTRIQRFEEHPAVKLGSGASYMISDLCSMRSILAYYLVETKLPPLSFKEELLAQQKHRLEDLESRNNHDYISLRQYKDQIQLLQKRIHRNTEMIQKYKLDKFSVEDITQDDLPFFDASNDEK